MQLVTIRIIANNESEVAKAIVDQLHRRFEDGTLIPDRVYGGAIAIRIDSRRSPKRRLK